MVKVISASPDVLGHFAAIHDELFNLMDENRIGTSQESFNDFTVMATVLTVATAASHIMQQRLDNMSELLEFLCMCHAVASTKGFDIPEGKRLHELTGFIVSEVLDDPSLRGVFNGTSTTVQ